MVNIKRRREVDGERERREKDLGRKKNGERKIQMEDDRVRDGERERKIIKKR